MYFCERAANGDGSNSLWGFWALVKESWGQAHSVPHCTVMKDLIPYCATQFYVCASKVKISIHLAQFMHIRTELYKVQFKFSSRHWTQQSTQVQFIRQKLNLNCCPTHHWTFLNWVQSQFRESGVPPCRKEEELGFFLVMTHKIMELLPFLVGGTPLSLNWLWTQFKKVQWWVEQQFKFSFCPMNWTWIDCWVQCRELNLNWTFWTLYSSGLIRLGSYLS